MKFRFVIISLWVLLGMAFVNVALGAQPVRSSATFVVDTAAIAADDAAACVIVVDCAVDDRGESGVVDTPTTKASTVIGNCAVIDDEYTAQVIDTPSNRPIVEVNKGIIQSQ